LTTCKIHAYVMYDDFVRCNMWLCSWLIAVTHHTLHAIHTTTLY